MSLTEAMLVWCKFLSQVMREAEGATSIAVDDEADNKGDGKLSKCGDGGGGTQGGREAKA